MRELLECVAPVEAALQLFHPERDEEVLLGGDHDRVPVALQALRFEEGLGRPPVARERPAEGADHEELGLGAGLLDVAPARSGDVPLGLVAVHRREAPCNRDLAAREHRPRRLRRRLFRAPLDLVHPTTRPRRLRSRALRSTRASLAPSDGSRTRGASKALDPGPVTAPD